MNLRSTPLIAALAVLPALSSCGEAPAEKAPLTEDALAAVTQDAGAPTKELAREVDDLFSLHGVGETRALVVMHGGKVAAAGAGVAVPPGLRTTGLPVSPGRRWGR